MKGPGLHLEKRPLPQTQLDKAALARRLFAPCQRGSRHRAQLSPARPVTQESPRTGLAAVDKGPMSSASPGIYVRIPAILGSDLLATGKEIRKRQERRSESVNFLGRGHAHNRHDMPATRHLNLLRIRIYVLVSLARVRCNARHLSAMPPAGRGLEDSRDKTAYRGAFSLLLHTTCICTYILRTCACIPDAFALPARPPVSSQRGVTSRNCRQQDT